MGTILNRAEDIFFKMADEAPYFISENLKPYIIECMEIYATECVKASLEKAAENAIVGERTEVRTDLTKPDKSSITSPDNIVLL